MDKKKRYIEVTATFVVEVSDDYAEELLSPSTLVTLNRKRYSSTRSSTKVFSEQMEDDRTVVSWAECADSIHSIIHG